jgi:hypothetical protein
MVRAAKGSLGQAVAVGVGELSYGADVAAGVAEAELDMEESEEMEDSSSSEDVSSVGAEGERSVVDSSVYPLVSDEAPESIAVAGEFVTYSALFISLFVSLSLCGIRE